MSNPLKVREHREAHLCTSAKAASSNAQSASDEAPQCIDFEEKYVEPSEIQVQLTTTSQVTIERVEPLSPVPENMRQAYDVFINAGISEQDARGLVFGGAAPEEARQHLSALLSATTNLAAFGPKAVAISVLSRIAASEEVNGREIREAIEAHRSLRVVRPDGYIANALSGEAIERAGEVSVSKEQLSAGRLEIGRFYASDQGLLYPVNAELQRVTGAAPVFELSLDRMAYGRFLDGFERAVRTAILGLGDAIKDPPQAMEKLAQSLGQAGVLLMSSPELAERFLAMPLNDQIESVSNIGTTLLLAKYVAGKAQVVPPGTSGSSGFIVNVAGSAACTIQLDFAVATAAVSAGRGLLGLQIVSPLLSVDSAPTGAASNSELSPRAEASLKRVSKLISKDAAAEKRKALPALVAENRRLRGKIEEHLRDPSLSERLRSELKSAREGLDNHLNDEDLTGALRDRVDLPVRAKGSGDAWAHDKEVTNAVGSLKNAREAISDQFRKSVRHGEADAALSELADQLLDMERRIEAFIDPAR